MFKYKSNNKTNIEDIAFNAGIAACECHGDVRRSICMAYRNEGMTVNVDQVNALTEKVNKHWKEELNHQPTTAYSTKFFNL